ncbi:MAG: hypothetical protein LC802_17950 [Acidobacteria bacterium]|nr:hypothetical protein [Acidobacteriota bacterium]
MAVNSPVGDVPAARARLRLTAAVEGDSKRAFGSIIAEEMHRRPRVLWHFLDCHKSPPRYRPDA